MTKCKRCGKWYDWLQAQNSDEIERAGALARKQGYNQICIPCMIDLIEEDEIQRAGTDYDWVLRLQGRLDYL